MPTYEYVCDACEHEFELLQRMSDPAVRKCPKCKKLKVRRIISGGAGVIFKGSGFYETDYKQKRGGSSTGSRRDESGSSSESKSETKSADAGAAKADTKSEPASKPEPKTESRSESKGDAKPSTGGSKGAAKKRDS
ncbi:MAG: zinc ribbon domain-containing protein [Planctomycetes bacterium]|nr:zinc ribbon domain-containing protein [Planctomycetota bacterium]